ncbi:hypothetical protein [Aliikangiella sp. IMCC44359]|uniref:hypothetical protein n=1 Tax=Aliikangiella sp. IMCC44359 TaxID=3459125 RepID=UPI00403ADB26
MSYNSSNIQIIDNSKFQPNTDIKFLVLGMLDEYMGRNITLGSNVVEHFYPNEGVVANIFADYLKSLASELNIETTIEIEKGEDRHLYVKSKEMSNFLISLYKSNTKEASDFTDAEGKKWQQVNLEVDQSMFPEMKNRQFSNQEMDSRYSYLYGAYIRYGKEGFKYRFANSSHKVKLVMNIIESLESDWVQMRKYLRGAPTTYEIEFGPSEVTKKFFESQTKG